MEESINKAVQKELKNIKKLTTVLAIVAILTSVTNIASTYNYQKLIKKEKVFLNKVEKTFLDIKANVGRH